MNWYIGIILGFNILMICGKLVAFYHLEYPRIIKVGLSNDVLGLVVHVCYALWGYSLLTNL